MSSEGEVLPSGLMKLSIPVLLKEDVLHNLRLKLLLDKIHQIGVEHYTQLSSWEGDSASLMNNSKLRSIRFDTIKEILLTYWSKDGSYKFKLITKSSRDSETDLTLDIPIVHLRPRCMKLDCSKVTDETSIIDEISEFSEVIDHLLSSLKSGKPKISRASKHRGDISIVDNSMLTILADRLEVGEVLLDRAHVHLGSLRSKIRILLGDL